MSFFNNLTIFSFILITPYLTFIHAAIFDIQNNCSYTVWAAAIPGGGRELKPNQTWVINGNDKGRIWARTNCDFTVGTGNKCESGDCGGVLHCQDSGAPPVTLLEYAVNAGLNLDFFDISLINGFNVPLEISPTTSGSGCTTRVKCTGDINRLCPTELRDPGGCHHPCYVFNNDQFCGANESTPYLKFFKDACPNVYISPYSDDATATFTCPTGTNYKVVFCP